MLLSRRTKTGGTPTKSSMFSEETPTLRLEWDPIAPLGPKAAFHVGGIVNDVLYIHGGIRDLSSNKPSDQFYRLDLNSNLWYEIHTTGCPALSHHAAVALENRYLLLIGGWDGKKRGSELYVYDTIEDKWSTLKQSGFPAGAGLSSHTASKLSDESIIIVGREGSLRTQRKNGNIYILSGSVSSGEFTYKEYSHDVMSRSGHTASVIGSYIFILGGRSDYILETAGSFQDKISKTNKNKNNNKEECSVLSDVLSAIESRHQAPLQRFPCGRKNHAAVTNGNCILVHGGETFDGRREPIGEMLLVLVKTPVVFFKLKNEQLKRAGHVCFTWSGKVLLHGGLSGKSNIHADLYDLKIIP